MLTDAALRNFKPKDQVYKVCDREGLYIYELKLGGISFRYNYSMNGSQEPLCSVATVLEGSSCTR